MENELPNLCPHTEAQFDEVFDKPKPRKEFKYISPSRISKWREDPEQLYLRYIAANAPGDEGQTQAMAIGSAFDAYAKSYIFESLFGKGVDPKYEFNTIFEAQVESQWRDWGRLHGMYVFDNYCRSGAMADLMLELQQAVNVPQFEIEITGVIENRREGKTMERGGVPFLGKPDVFFINKHGAHVIIDWKVNGYCSRYPKSPMAGYVQLRQDTRRTGKHKDCKLVSHHGVLINGTASLHEFDLNWATQLAVYAWLCGCEVGEDFIAGIDQICCSPGGEFPLLRFAEHRMRISSSFQYETFALAQEIWDCCHSDHFFRNMTKEESQQRCLMLDRQTLDNSKMDPMFLALTQSRPKWK